MRGLPPPEALQERPRLFVDLIPIWNCWLLLDSVRGLDGVVGGLHLSIGECLDIYCVRLDDRPRWIRLLVAMEQAFRSHLNRPAETPAKPGGKTDG